jgi:hypothetical protein
MNIQASLLIESFAQRVYGTVGPDGNRVPLSLDKIQLKPYTYTLSFVALAQAAVQTQTLLIQANSDFILTAVKLRASLGAVQNLGNSTVPFIRLLMTDSGTNEQFTSAPVDAAIYCEVPGINTDGSLPYPRLLTGRSSVVVQATNWAPAAETYTFDIQFEGTLARIYG